MNLQSALDYGLVAVFCHVFSFFLAGDLDDFSDDYGWEYAFVFCDEFFQSCDGFLFCFFTGSVEVFNQETCV